MLDETIELTWTEEILVQEIDYLTHVNEENNEEIKGLQDSINDLSGKVEAGSNSVTTGWQQRDNLETVQKSLEEKHDSLSKRLQFLKENYDYTFNVKNLDVKDFKYLMATNEHVNKSMENFITQLIKTQDEYIHEEGYQNK